MKKIILAFMCVFLLVGCESKKERVKREEMEKTVVEITEVYENEKYNETISKVEEFKIKFPNSEKIEELDEMKNKSIKAIDDIRKAEEELKKKREKLKKIYAKFDETKKKINTRYDEFSKIMYFEPKNKKKYSKRHLRELERVDLYGTSIDPKGDYPTNIIVVFKYFGDEWIFFDTITILAGGESRMLSFSPYQGSREVFDRGVYEEGRVPLDVEDMRILEKAVNDEAAKVRFSGKTNYDFFLSDNEKYKIKNMLIAYKHNLEFQITD